MAERLAQQNPSIRAGDAQSELGLSEHRFQTMDRRVISRHFHGNRALFLLFHSSFQAASMPLSLLRHQSCRALCHRRPEIADHHSFVVGIRSGSDWIGIIVAVVTYGLGLAFELVKKKHSAVARILLADDHVDVFEALRILLKSEGYQTEGVTRSPHLHALEKKEYALLLMDLNYTRDTTSGQEGLSAIQKFRKSINAAIVVMTAWASNELRRGSNEMWRARFRDQALDNQRFAGDR